MPDIWDTAIDDAVSKVSLLKPSELQVNMIVRNVNGDREHRVIECLTAPDGFVGQGIFRTMDSHGYDQTFVYAFGGKNDDPVWILLGWYSD